MTNVTANVVSPLAQADLLLLIARLLSPPTPSDADRWRVDAHTRQTMIEWAGFADAVTLNIKLTRALDAAIDTPHERWVEAYTGLFDGAVPCPVNETAYIRRDKGWILADICGFYDAFGFRVSDRVGEKADHLVCELEFCAMLLAMIARANQLGDNDHAAVAEDALVRFAHEHLGDWLPLFADRLESVAAMPLYRHTAQLLGTTWQAVAVSHGVPQADGPAATMPDDDPGTPYECGMADAEVDVRVNGAPLS